MMIKNIFKKLFLITFFILVTNLCFAMQCPTNFNTISLGDSIDTIIKLCGNPDSKTEDHFTETNSLQNSNTLIQGNSNVSESNNQDSGTTINQEITIVTFVYKYPQKAILIFRNGILIERKLPIPGDSD